VSSKEGKI